MKTAVEYIRELIQQTRPSMSYGGGDLASWQKEAREKLAELLGLDKFQKCEPEFETEYVDRTDGATEIRFTFQSEKGYRVPCHLLLPDGVDNPPVMIALQGHTKGMHVSLNRKRYPNEENQPADDGDRDFAIRAIKEGFAAVTLEQRNFGECGGDANGPRCYEESMTALLIGRTTIGERVWDVMRLIDVLETEFADKIDLNCICLMGNSGGGTATAYTAALERRLKLAMPGCAVSAFKDSIGAMGHCSCNFVPKIAEFFDMGDLICMAAPTAYIQVNGEVDPIFPIEPAKEMFAQGKKAYEALGIPEKAVHVIGGEGHRFYSDLSWPYVHRFTGR
jgi:hypothetical protein